MKVLIVHTTYKYKGGEDTVVAEEIKLLQANDVTVELLKFDNDKNALIKLLQLPFNLKSYLKTKNCLQTFKPDIVHVHNLHFGASASVIYAIRKSKVPFVITLHNFRLICPSAILFYKGKSFLNSLYQEFPWKAIQQGVYKNSVLLTFWVSLSMRIHNLLGLWKSCSRFIVLNDHAKKLFLQSKLQLNSRQITVKPNFCAPPALVEHVVSDYFLYVGRLSEEKGIQMLLKTFSSSTFKIKIAGNGPLKDEVIRYSLMYANIEFLGSLNKDDVFSLLQSSSALVFPSIWYEGMPLTIIEAFACGTPVIASKLGAMETMIINEYNGLHFLPENVNDLSYKLEEWQRLNDEEKTIYRKNALHTYEQYYTPEKNAEQLLAIYRSVITEKKGRVPSIVKQPI